MSGVTREAAIRDALPLSAHPGTWDAQAFAQEGGGLHQLDAAALEELDAAARHAQDCGKPLEALNRADFPLPRLAPEVARWRHGLLHGRGFLQLRGYTPGRHGRAHDACVFWGLSLHLGDRFASQNKHGHLLGHVTDLGESRDNVSQRGPYSREQIPYHVDACDMVGLMCLAPALSGGESSIVSSGQVYNVMRARRPELAAALMQPVYRDRRDEVPPGKAPWYAIPVFSWYAGLLTGCIEPTYIGSVARHFGGVNPHSERQLEAVDYAQRLAQELHFDIGFESGDMQFVHNHTVFHSRQRFTDATGQDNRRHLLRLWLLADDGRPLPDAFYGRQGDRASVRRPGGIFAAGTRPHAPLFSAVEAQGA